VSGGDSARRSPVLWPSILGACSLLVACDDGDNDNDDDTGVADDGTGGDDDDVADDDTGGGDTWPGPATPPAVIIDVVIEPRITTMSRNSPLSPHPILDTA
jgi:hypothetical protein